MGGTAGLNLFCDSPALPGVLPAMPHDPALPPSGVLRSGPCRVSASPYGQLEFGPGGGLGRAVRHRRPDARVLLTVGEGIVLPDLEYRHVGVFSPAGVAW